MASLEIQHTNDTNDTNDTNTAINHFNYLSNELLLNILHFLDPHFIVKLSQTNRHFRSIITDKENLILLYKNFKKIYSFWKLFPHLDAPLDTPLETHQFDLKTFMILSRFQNGIKSFIKGKTELRQNFYDKGLKMGFSRIEINTLFNSFCDKQIINALNLKYNGIDYTLNYENSYLTDLQVELAIKLKQKQFEEVHIMYYVSNLTNEKIEVALKLDKDNFNCFIIYCPDVFTDENIAKINRLVEDGFEECCAMNIVNPIIFTTEEQFENLIKLKKSPIVSLIYDFDEQNINTYILSYYANKFTTAQIDNVIKYFYIDNIFHYAELFTEQQWLNFYKLPATLSEDLSLYVAQYFTDLQVENITTIIEKVANINHNWCIFYVEKLNLEQLANVIKLFIGNQYIKSCKNKYMKYRLLYEMVKCYTTEQISYLVRGLQPLELP